MQFLRDFATSPAAPNLLLCPMDQNFPWASDDFGKSFYTPNWNGMWVGRTGVSAWIDPQDASRQLLLYSAGSQSFDRTSTPMPASTARPTAARPRSTSCRCRC